ncbi:DHS-like NAD/FAD-binding domain-containing protein [Cantharellus anzutake]|uniref:DHS-like NAD/FAD-binding domain-containing protein n=1 Tax=Cantharellus anzutake TaxID=1750568 RepID=UPI001902C76A|nr:DHS-like NAD/FAD-binding domain-containing protein [Cantharellus anzutake]KAF8325816.1 DHS-like NAD/FAD-binding domain-containing protein [Cantharellus anzutake]
MPLHLELGALESASSPSTPDHAGSRKSLHALSLAVAKSKRVIVVTGAGISCSSGIPDFRSSDGLYNLVKSRYPNVVLRGRDLFSASLFREPESTRLFYSFIAELKLCIDKAHPAPAHHFIKTLDTKGKLLRSYTQNIDGLEDRVNLPSSAYSTKGKGKLFNSKEVKNVQLHGDIHRVRCVICNASFPYMDEHLSTFLNGAPPPCPDCSNRSESRIARNARALAVGTLRPSIILYDEAHPHADEIGIISTRDISRKPDLVIIMGTSLKVHGIKRLVKDFAGAVHATSKDKNITPDATQTTLPTSPSQACKPSSVILTMKNTRLVVFVNRTPPPADLASFIDVWVEGDTDVWCAKVEADWRRARPQDWEVQSSLSSTVNKEKEGGSKENHHWHVVKDYGITGKEKGKGKAFRGKIPLTGSENLYPSLGSSGSRPIPPSSPTRLISNIPKSRLKLVKNANAVPSLPPVIPSRPIPKKQSAEPQRPISPSQIPLPASPQKRRPPITAHVPYIDLSGDGDDECGVIVDPLSAQHPRKRQAISRQPTFDKLVYDVPTKPSNIADMSIDIADPFVVAPPLSQSSDTGTLCMPLSQSSEATLIDEDQSYSQSTKVPGKDKPLAEGLSFPVMKSSKAAVKKSRARSRSTKPPHTVNTTRV